MDASTRRATSVVVVDDEPDIRRIVRVFLDRDGRFEVIGEAADGAEAVETTAELRPDIVLLDLMMPRMDGHEALSRIVRDTPQTMVVVLSALDKVAEEERTLSLGAFAYLEKTELGPGLADVLSEQHERFTRALGGETVIAPAVEQIAGSVRTRPHGGGDPA